MNRFFTTGLTALAFTAIVPSVAQANPITYDFNTVEPTSIRQIAPSDLVLRARQGQLRKQGIPGAMQLTSEYTLGRIDAEKLIRAAIAARILPTDAANDADYLDAVTTQLRTRIRLY